MNAETLFYLFIGSWCMFLLVLFFLGIAFVAFLLVRSLYLRYQEEKEKDDGIPSWILTVMYFVILFTPPLWIPFIFIAVLLSFSDFFFS